jgi:hypothetical protein
MIIPLSIRNDLIRMIQSLIDAHGQGKIIFKDNTNAQLAIANLAPQSMVINNGVGIFVNITPYLRANVIQQGMVNRWSIVDAVGVDILTGTIGNQKNLGKDITFNTNDFMWNVGDVVVIEELSLTIPSGQNDYI